MESPPEESARATMHGHYRAAPIHRSLQDGPGLTQDCNLRTNQHELMAVMQNFPNDHTSARHCPGCGAANECALAHAPSAQSPAVAIQSCWCYQQLDPAARSVTSEHIQPLSTQLACYCARCFQQMQQTPTAAPQLNSPEHLPPGDSDFTPAAHSKHG